MPKQQHIDVYRSTTTLSGDEPCPCDPDIESARHHGERWMHHTTVTAWRWRMRAGNGRIVSTSSEGYDRPRDLIRGLELAMPGFELAESVNGRWFMLSPDLMVPVRVPAGSESMFRARRR